MKKRILCLLITVVMALGLIPGTSLTAFAQPVSVSIMSVDIDDGASLSGAKIQILDAGGRVCDEWISTTEALEIEGLRSNETYTLKAVTAPIGYTIPSEYIFSVDEQGNVNFSGTVSSEGILLIKFDKTKVSVSAVDAADGEILIGATLQILDAMGNVVEEWVSTIEEYKIEALVADETHILKVVSAPDGFTIPSETTFTIDKLGNVSYDGTSTTGQNGITTMLVEFDKTRVSVLSVDIDDGAGLEGAIIQVVDSNGDVWDEWVSTTDVYYIDGLDTNEVYTLKSVVAPNGYIIPLETTFTIDEQGNVNSSGTVSADGDLMVEFYKTRVSVSAVDATDGNNLSGATLQILDNNGIVVEEWVSTADVHNIDGLRTAVEYTLRTTAVPDKYIIPDDTAFSINENGNIISTGSVDIDGTILAVIDTIPLAYYTVETYVMDTNGNYGTPVVEIKTAEIGEIVSVAPSAKTGFTIDTSSVFQDTAKEDGSTVLTVYYSRNKYTFSVVTDGVEEQFSYYYEKTIPTLADPTKTGYTFAGWDKEIPAAMPAENVTVTAKWTLNPPEPTYPPVVDRSENGDVAVTPVNPEKDDNVTITPEPDTDCEVDKIVVTDAEGNPVTVVDNGDGTYSFVQPDSTVNIKVTFKEIVKVCAGDDTCPMRKYSDLKTDAWYHDSIHFCIENNMMNGTSADTFSPAVNTSRSMLITILWRLEGAPVVNYEMSFKDVEADKWYTEAVRWAQSNKIVTGYNDETFGTDDVITREQLATILYRYYQYKGGSFDKATVPMEYVDIADVSLWAYEAMCWTNTKGIINGKPNNLLDPKGNATRAETATMLYRYCNQ